MFFLAGPLIRTVLIVASIGWVIWYFKKLPKNIRELKESKEQYQNCNNPSVSERFESEERKTKHQEGCQLEYQSNLSILIIFSLVTILASIYAVRSLIGLAEGIIQAFR